MYQNCSDQLWEKIVLVIKKTFEIQGCRLRICKMFEITRTIYSNSERSEQFLVTECFFYLFLFLVFNKLEQLGFKLEKIIGILKHTGKVRKYVRILLTCHHGEFAFHLKLNRLYCVDHSLHHSIALWNHSIRHLKTKQKWIKMDLLSKLQRFSI